MSGRDGDARKCVRCSDGVFVMGGCWMMFAVAGCSGVVMEKGGVDVRRCLSQRTKKKWKKENVRAFDANCGKPHPHLPKPGLRRLRKCLLVHAVVNTASFTTPPSRVTHEQKICV